MPTDRLDAARRLATRGLSVIPIGDDKRPVVAWLPYQERHASDDELVRWFGGQSPRNLGIVTGKVSGVVVIDTDNAEAEAWAESNLPPTPMMCKTAKGMHRYYRHPGSEVRNGARITTNVGTLALDVRGDGGYVVGPTSTHPSGITYTAPSKWPAIEEVPVFDPVWIASPTLPTRSAATSSDDRIPAGQRNAMLASLAGGMQRRGMSSSAMLAALNIENDTRCDPPLPQVEVETIVASIGRYEHSAPARPPALVIFNDADLINRPPPTPVIEDRIFTKSLIALYGPPGIGKTFVAQDLAYCVASGLPWLGASVMRAGTVVYVAAEGDGGLTLRVRAWKTFHEMPLDQAVGVWTVPTSVNLMDSVETRRLIDGVRHLAPGLVVFDTLARCLVGGDENSAKDMGLLVRHCDEIRTELNAVVMLVHHTQKNGPTERGSGALRGACETMLELTSANDLLTLSCDKQKDAMPFRPQNLTLHTVRNTESCVVRLADSGLQSMTLTHAEHRALSALRQHFSADGASATDWLKAAQIPERSFYRVRKRLEDLGYVRKEGPRVVWTGKPAGDE